MRKGIIWMLHRVAPAREKTKIFNLDMSLRISPDFLETQILSCREQGFNFVSMDKFLKDKNDTSIHNNICITIDDGFRDIYQYAFPLFKKHRVPFLFYVSSDFINNGFTNCLKPEADGMQLLMDIVADNPVINVFDKTYENKTAEQKKQTFAQLWTLFTDHKKQMPQKTGQEIFTEFFPDIPLDFAAYKKEYLCTWNELKEMSDNEFCTIGSHGLSHQWLSLIQSPAPLENEFLSSKSDIETHIGKKIHHFSYPYGQYNTAAVEFAQKYYTSAVTIQITPENKRRFVIDTDNNYTLPRISIQENVCTPLFTGTAIYAPTRTKKEKRHHFLEKIFSLKINGHKRVLTILGIKIKYKRTPQ